MERLYRVPFHSLFPVIAIAVTILTMGTVVYFNQAVSILFLDIIGIGYVYFPVLHGERESAAQSERAPGEALVHGQFAE